MSIFVRFKEGVGTKRAKEKTLPNFMDYLIKLENNTLISVKKSPPTMKRDILWKKRAKLSLPLVRILRKMFVWIFKVSTNTKLFVLFKIFINKTAFWHLKTTETI
jgi:hypothetical protein